MDNTIPNTTDGPVATTGVDAKAETILIHPTCVYTDIDRALKAASRLDGGKYTWTVTPDSDTGSFLVFTKTLAETGETAGTYVVPCNCGAPTKKDIADNIVPFLNGIGVNARFGMFAPNITGRNLGTVAAEAGDKEEAPEQETPRKLSLETEEALLSYGRFIKHGPHVTIDVTDGDNSTVMRFTVSCKAFNGSRSEGGDELLKFIGGVPGACSGCCAFPDDAPVCIHTECPFDDINIALAYTGSKYRAVVGVSDNMKEVCRISKAGMGGTYYEADLNADGVWEELADVVSRHTGRKVVVTTSRHGLTITEAESDACNFNDPVAVDADPVAVDDDGAACPEQEDPASGIDVVDYNQNTEGLWEEDRVNLQFENKGPYTHVSVRDKDSGRVLRRLSMEYRRGVPLTVKLCTLGVRVADSCRKQVEVMHLETIAADANWILSLYGSSHCVTVADEMLCVSENGLEGEGSRKYYRLSDRHLGAFKNYIARLAGIACVELVKEGEDGKLYALKPFTGEDKAAEFKMRGCTGGMGYPLWCSGAPTVAMGLRDPRWVHAVLSSDVWNRSESESAHCEVHPNIDSAEKLVRYVYGGDRSDVRDDIPLLIMDRPYPEYPCAPSDCGEVNIRREDPVAVEEEPQAEREPDLDRCVDGPVEVRELENLLVSADRGALASIDWFVEACASSKIPSTTIMSAGAECSIMVNRTGNGYVTVSIHDIKSGKDVYRIALEAEDASSFMSERGLDETFVAGHGSLAPAKPKVGVIRAGHEVADVNRLLLHAKNPGMCATVTALTRTLNISFFGVGADAKSYALNGERERNAAMEGLCRDVERLTGIETCVYTRRVTGTDLGEPFSRTEMLVSGQWRPIVMASELMRDGSLGNLNSYLLKGGSCDPCIVTRFATLNGKKGLRTVNAMGRFEDASYPVDTVDDAFESFRRLSVRFYGLRGVRLIDDVSVVGETSTGEEKGK